MWVAAAAIPRGTSVKDAVAKKMIVQDVVPARSAPRTAITELPPGDLMATSDISAGEVILSGRFKSAAEQAPALLAVPEGKVAVSASLGDPQKVGTFVQPGDWVGVYLSQGNMTRTLLSRVQVLGVGAATSQPKEGDPAAASSIMTLALTPDEAARFITAQNVEGGLYLALLPAEGSVPATIAEGLGH